jgi:hypothetical protein
MDGEEMKITEELKLLKCSDINNRLHTPRFRNKFLYNELYIIECDSKLLLGFPWPIIFKPEKKEN